MIDESSVVSALKREYRLPEAPEAVLLGICRGVCLQMENEVKPSADRTDIRLVNLAAAKAYRKLVFRVISSDGEVSSFKAGDVTITQNPIAAASLSEVMLEEARQAAAELLADSGFAFMKVKG